MKAKAKAKAKIIVELSEKELIRYMEQGKFKGMKIVKIDWIYESFCVDGGRGNGVYENRVAGAIVTVEGNLI